MALKRMVKVTITVMTDAPESVVAAAADDLRGRAFPGLKESEVWDAQVAPATPTSSHVASSLLPIPGLVKSPRSS